MVELLGNTDQLTYFWYLNVAKVDFDVLPGERELQRVGGTVRLRIRSCSVRSADCSVADIAPAELVNSGAYPRLVLEVVFVTLGALMKTVPFHDLGEAVKFIAALEITSLC